MKDLSTLLHSHTKGHREKQTKKARELASTWFVPDEHDFALKRSRFYLSFFFLTVALIMLHFERYNDLDLNGNKQALLPSSAISSRWKSR